MASGNSRRARHSRPRLSRKKQSAEPPERKTFDIPYFAHQQLDPEYFALVPALTLPVGKPQWQPAPKEIATATNGGWGNDADAPLDEDPHEDLEEAESVKPRVAKGKKRQANLQGNGEFVKRLQTVRVPGGRPAVAKKVTADLDSEDELIVRMKNARYLEKDIAQRLIDEGRIQYNPKTIGTRWARLRKVLAQRNDELLDAEVTDWHDGDDDVLKQAYRRANELTEKAKAEAEARRWRLVADQMKSLKPVTNFSQFACRERYQALQRGTAKPTPESILNPDEATLARIQSRREKEERIAADAMMMGIDATQRDNLQGNAWTSKGRTEI